jgi:hypothetical protein
VPALAGTGRPGRPGTARPGTARPGTATAGTARQIRNQGEVTATAIVCMTAGGRVTMPDGADRGPLPWAS